MTTETYIVFIASFLSLILFLVFLILKLRKSIGWSWFWVLAPLWIPAYWLVLNLTVLKIP